MAFRTSNACKSSCLRIDVLCWFPEEMHVVWKLKLHLQSTKTSNWPVNFLFSFYNLKYFSSIPKKCFISLWQWLTFHLQIDKIFHWEERCSVTNLFRLPTLMTSLQSQYLAIGYNVQWILKHIFLWRRKDVHQYIFRMKIIDWGLTTTAIFWLIYPNLLPWQYFLSYPSHIKNTCMIYSHMETIAPTLGFLGDWQVKMVS